MLELFGISNLFLSKDNACNARATAPFGLGAPSLRSMFGSFESSMLALAASF